MYNKVRIFTSEHNIIIKRIPEGVRYIYDAQCQESKNKFKNVNAHFIFKTL